MISKGKISTVLAALALAVGVGVSAPSQAVAATVTAAKVSTPHGVPYEKGKEPKTKALLTGGYKYAGGSDTPATPKTGSFANITVGTPATDVGDHSLVELSVQGGTNNRALIVEVGWVKDKAFGDAAPHLFASRWVNNVWAGCYFEGCGWVDATPTVTTDDLGKSLASVASAASPGNVKSFGIQWFNDAWWVSYDGAWIGYWNDDLWQYASPAVTPYNSGSFFQAFGEVWSNTGTSCTDMGNGLFSSNSNAAGIYSWAYLPSGTYPASTWGIQDHPSEYTSTYLSGRSARIGGSGPC